MKERYQEKTESYKIRNRQHYEEHREEAIAKQHAYYQLHREECIAAVSHWQSEHPEICKAIHRNRNSKKSVVGSFTPAEWLGKLEEFHNCCAYCGSPTIDILESALTIDHIVPLSRGGSNFIDNIVPACSRCNFEKHTMTAEEFLESIDAGKQEGILVRRYLSTHPEVREAYGQVLKES